MEIVRKLKYVKPGDLVALHTHTRAHDITSRKYHGEDNTVTLVCSCCEDPHNSDAEAHVIIYMSEDRVLKLMEENEELLFDMNIIRDELVDGKLTEALITIKRILGY